MRMAKTGFAARLKELREWRRLTTERLAELTSIPREELLELEQEHSDPSWLQVTALAQALGVRTDDFLMGEKTDPRLDQPPVTQTPLAEDGVQVGKPPRRKESPEERAERQFRKWLEKFRKWLEEEVKRQIAGRRGQSEFRRVLIAAYGQRCAITGCDAEEALEAAHIVPYKIDKCQDARNGVLLRADIHTLFDLQLLRIDPESLRIVVMPGLENTCYRKLTGRQLRLPEDSTCQPNKEQLLLRWRLSNAVAPLPLPAQQ
jgi:transcriptional regulator with XRE-family HTH domain